MKINMIALITIIIILKNAENNETKPETCKIIEVLYWRRIGQKDRESTFI